MLWLGREVVSFPEGTPPASHHLLSEVDLLVRVTVEGNNVRVVSGTIALMRTSAAGSFSMIHFRKVKFQVKRPLSSVDKGG